MNNSQIAKRALRPNGKIIIMSYTMDHLKISHIIGMTFRYLKTYGKPSPTVNKKR